MKSFFWCLMGISLLLEPILVSAGKSPVFDELRGAQETQTLNAVIIEGVMGAPVDELIAAVTMLDKCELKFITYN